MNNYEENPIKVIASRHSAFYTPLLLTVDLGSSDANFMKTLSEGFNCDYSVAENNQNVYEMIMNNEIDIAQSSVGGSWNNEYSSEIIHFAEINKTDGFYIVRKDSITDKEFEWSDLIGSKVLVDHSKQPNYMFKYACHKKNIEYSKIDVIDGGSPEEMVNEFRNGNADYVHLQAPQSTDLTYNVYDEDKESKTYGEITRHKVGDVVASIGKAVGPLSFSSLICKKSYTDTPEFHKFIEIFHTTKLFAQTESSLKIAEITNEFFPDTELEYLDKTIKNYQDLNCWNGDLTISEDHYDKSLEVFKFNGLEGIFPYSEVVLKSNLDNNQN
ncbi:MAG: hypothetical protein CL762_03275 [Chloroflexi bacterium]|nr:hypothetical protein [Chloroflexota bacterium]|tara:strand:- start:13595 stop:14575 length:981 start_codon:yes stop_codon:yes gene_type:complete